MRSRVDEKKRLTRKQLTGWVTVCPRCDAVTLERNAEHGWPFFDHDGVMRTVHDYDGQRLRPDSITTEFSGFKFSRRALNAGVHLAQLADPTTVVEELGRRYFTQPTDQLALEFSEAVCRWGRGQRVFANLLRHHGPASLAARLNGWLSESRRLDPYWAIARGIQIKGLAVSFASKHLRMLRPDRFAVLDDVLVTGLGVAANPAGYRLFMELLERFRDEHQFDLSLAQFEMGLFLLVRQEVRSSN